MEHDHLVLLVMRMIEEDAMNEGDSKMARQLLGYVRLLKMAISVPTYLTPEAQHARMIEQERAVFRAARAQGASRQELQEIPEPRVVSLQGGPDDGVFVPIASDMPEGARTNIEGHVYQLRGGILVHEA